MKYEPTNMYVLSLTFEKLAASFLEGSHVHVGVIYPRRRRPRGSTTWEGGHVAHAFLKVMISHIPQKSTTCCNMIFLDNVQQPLSILQ